MHVLDHLGHERGCFDVFDDEAMGQSTLVDHLDGDGIVIEPYRPVVLAVHQHALSILEHGAALRHEQGLRAAREHAERAAARAAAERQAASGE